MLRRQPGVTLSNLRPDIESENCEIFFEKLCFSAKNWCSFVIDLSKINICGDKMVS